MNLLKKKIVTFLLISLFFSLFLILSGSFLPKSDNKNKEDNGKCELETAVLGDHIKDLGIPNSPFGITTLKGAIWAGTKDNTSLFKININTGDKVAEYDVGFEIGGLASDGTYLYASVEDSVDNGTIYKLDTNGSIISSFEIDISNDFEGLAYDGSSLWAPERFPNHLLKINPSNGDILANYSIDDPIAGLTYFNGYVWGIAYESDEIHIFNPSNGRIEEVFDFGFSGGGEYGLANNGTYILISFWHNNSISFLDYPTEPGEVFNRYNSAAGHPLGFDWNGTHYFVADSASNEIVILDDGTFESVRTISLAYDPWGIVIFNNYLYVYAGDTNKIHKYNFDVSPVATYSPGIDGYDLATDGTYIYLTWELSDKISKLDPTSDCSLLQTFFVEEEYAGITYDSVNHVFWGVGWTSDKIYQLDISGFNQTGTKINAPTTSGEYGLSFNGEHLIFGSHNTNKFYKIIIDLQSSSGSPPSNNIPGFNIYIFFFSNILIVSIGTKRYRKRLNSF